MEEIKSIVRRNRRVLSALGFVLAIVLIFWAVNSPVIVGVSSSQRELPIYCVQREDKVVAISFDAAWGNEDTQSLIDILDRYQVKTTFFVVGDWVDRYPESVKALAEAGHEVMSHSSHHAHFSQLSSEQIKEDLAVSSGKISAITGVTPELFRCPYGEYDDHVIRAVKEAGMTAIQWDVERSHINETQAADSKSRASPCRESALITNSAQKLSPQRAGQLL